MKNIIILVLVLIVTALMYVVFNKDDIMNKLREEEKVSYIGETLSDELFVYDNNKNKYNLKSMIGAPTTIFLYSDTCPPCKMAIDSYEAYFNDKQAPKPERNLLVVVFDDEIPERLKEYKNLTILNIVQSRSETIMDGYPTPVFYHFDKNAKLTKKYIGWATDPTYLDKTLAFNTI